MKKSRSFQEVTCFGEKQISSLVRPKYSQPQNSQLAAMSSSQESQVADYEVASPESQVAPQDMEDFLAPDSEESVRTKKGSRRALIQNLETQTSNRLNPV